MSNHKLLSMVAQVVLAACVLTLVPAVHELAATCTGSDPCHACKNCRYCKHCAKEGGTCGICRGA
jgi:hypothetical protein